MCESVCLCESVCMCECACVCVCGWVDEYGWIWGWVSVMSLCMYRCEVFVCVCVCVLCTHTTAYICECVFQVFMCISLCG